MNVRPSVQELDRIRKDIGAALREHDDVVMPAPESLVALLRYLETHVRETERERLLAEIDARIADRYERPEENCGRKREVATSAAEPPNGVTPDVTPSGRPRGHELPQVRQLIQVPSSPSRVPANLISNCAVSG
jgi:hypothetical protein